MSPIERAKVRRDAQAYLNSQMYKAANDVGYEHMTTPNPSSVHLPFGQTIIIA